MPSGPNASMPPLWKVLVRGTSSSTTRLDGSASFGFEERAWKRAIFVHALPLWQALPGAM